MKLKKLFVLLLMINIFALIGVVLIFDEYQKATIKLQHSYETQYKSMIIADELRQSSDDLTRMARTYVLTGKSMFEDQFHKVLDIRNGKLNRPQYYNHIYWDFLTLPHSEVVLQGEKKSLRVMMKELDFADKELDLLFQSAEKSDKLTYLEAKAMNAVKGLFQDTNGNYTIKAKADLKLAADIMHGDAYHQAKIEIMKPIDKFYRALEERTKKFVSDANKSVQLLGKYLSGAISLLIFLVLFSFFIILSRIIHPLEALKNSMLQLAKNDMDTKLPRHEFDDEVGDMLGSVEIFKDNAIRLFQKEEKLKIAIKAAKEANHSKSIFLANMSHELRTPLNAILGFTSLLKKSLNVSTQEKENLTIISKSGNHLLSIINEILELSKIEVGKLEIVNAPFDLFHMIEELQSMFEERCKKKNIVLMISMDKNVSQYISSDQQRLKQILINLLGNSLKFTDSGFIRCDIKVSNHKLYFSVEDTGIGISKENQEIIFKQFEQINTKKHTKNGTGLGLSITKELIKLMGGKIKVKSHLDKGSIFSFDIKYISFNRDDLFLDNKDEQQQQPLVFAQDVRIIVADDIKENRKLLVQILSQYDVTPIEAQDGVEVLEILKSQKIDMIFLDILMPNLNGYETMFALQKDNKTKNIPIVVVSANVFKEDKEKALALGASAFLAKPITDFDLYTILANSIAIKNTPKKSIEIEDNFIILEQCKKSMEESIKKLDGNSILELLEKYNFPLNLKNDITQKVKTFRFDEINV